MITTTKNLLLLTVTTCIMIIVIEVGLRLFTVFPVHTPTANRIEDEVLSYRMSPRLAGIDENGFRNPEVLDSAELVTLGDSQTYGFNARPEHTWPQQLADQLDVSVYNFGVGGYSPLQTYALIDDALALDPDLMVISLTLANDLNDVCALIVQSDYWAWWADEAGYDVSICPPEPPAAAKTLRFWWAQTAIGSLTESVWHNIALWRQFAISSEDAKQQTDEAVIVPAPIETIISTAVVQRHIEHTDLSQPHIALGLEITIEVLKTARAKANAKRAQFAVLIIPTKEAVLHTHLVEQGYVLPDYFEVAQMQETQLVARLAETLGEADILYVDARPYMLQAVQTDSAVFAPSTDNHPLANGYAAYADALYELFASETGE